MKPRGLLVLAVVVAVLAGFIWFVERDLPSTDERGERAKKVLALDGEDVTAVEIRRDDAVVRLERVAADEGDGDGGSEWRLVEPLAARADGGAVDALIEDLTGLEKSRTLDDFDAAGLGLAAPRATVIISAGDEERTLLVGEEVPASSSVIVALAGAAQALVVADLPWSDLTRPAGEWRSREVFTAERQEVATIRLAAEGEVLLRRGDDGFFVAEPFTDEADREKVDELLNALTGLRVAAFLDDPDEPDDPRSRGELGLEPATASVTVTLAGGDEPVQIVLGSPAADDDKTLYAALGDLRFTADTRLAELAARDPDAWRATAWTRLEVYEIDAVEVRRGETVFALERSEGNWLRDGAEIAYTAASDLLYGLRDAKAERVVERAAVELPAEPLYEIVLTAGEARETLRLYPQGSAGFPAERDGRDSLLLLAAAAVDELVEAIEEAQRAAPVAAAGSDEPSG